MEEIIVKSLFFKNIKKVKVKNRELITLKLKKGLLGINYLKTN